MTKTFSPALTSALLAVARLKGGSVVAVSEWQAELLRDDCLTSEASGAACTVKVKQ